VCSLGQQDAVIGRSMLWGAADVLDQVSIQDVARMLRLTRPLKSSEPQAAEHALLRSKGAFRCLAFDEAIALATRAWRIASSNKQGAFATEIAAWIMFFNLEQGKRDQARDWFPVVSSSRVSIESRLFAINASLAFQWNFGDVSEAGTLMREGLDIIHRGTRRQQLHFWANTAVFAAENGDLRLAREALQEAEAVWIEAVDVALGTTVSLARVNILTREGEAGQAIRASESHIAECHTRENWVCGLYACEANAQALHRAGRPSEAASAWRRNEARRKAAGGHLTDRLKRQRAAIL
jgi:hypothetical protein